MRCSMCGMNDCCGADMEQEIDALRAEVARLRAENAELRKERDEARSNYQWMVDRACDERLDGYRELGSRAAAAENSRDELRAQIAAHKKCCAGVWVSVTERLPEPRRVVSTRTADNSWMPSNWIEGGVWRIENNRVVEWLDARMPGGEE